MHEKYFAQPTQTAPATHTDTPLTSSKPHPPQTRHQVKIKFNPCIESQILNESPIKELHVNSILCSKYGRVPKHEPKGCPLNKIDNVIVDSDAPRDDMNEIAMKDSVIVACGKKRGESLWLLTLLLKIKLILRRLKRE